MGEVAAGSNWHTGDGKAVLVDQALPYFLRINQEEELGSETDHPTQGSSVGKQTSRPLMGKNLYGLWRWEKLPASQESLSERSIRY